MTEAFYKVGDVLEFKSSQYFPAYIDSIPGAFRALIIRVDDPEYEYVSYRLLLFSKECNNFINRYVSALQKDIIAKAKRIGHIDISLLRFEEKEQEEPDYENVIAACARAESEYFRYKCVGIKNENETLKRENEELRAANEKLAEVGARYSQKITCAEKELSGAATCIYEARKHLSMALYRTDNK